MADFTVFYSWQSDIPKRITREVIHNATQTAIDRLNLDASIEDAPRIDHDTLDVAGAPELARTIFEKIENAGIFIADLTFVGESKPLDQNKKVKKLPNANVLIELGYAVAQIGWDRIILVFNSNFGSSEELPFDLVHRRFPIKFKLTPNSTNIEGPQEELSNEIGKAIKLSMSATHSAAERAIERLDLSCVQVCLEHGRSPYFSVRPYGNLNDRLARMEERDSLARLLDLRLIRANYNLGAGKYAYHWTYLGKRVVDMMGIPKAAETIVAAPLDLPPFTINVTPPQSDRGAFQIDVSGVNEEPKNRDADD